MVAYPLSIVQVSFGEGKRETAVESSCSTRTINGVRLIAPISGFESSCMFKYATWRASDARSWPQALTAPHRALVKEGIANRNQTGHHDIHIQYNTCRIPC